MKKTAGILIIALFLLVLLGTSVPFVVHQKEFVVVKQFGRIVRSEEAPGLYLKLPFIQTTQRVSTAIELYDIPASDVITKDKKSMIADNYVLWRVNDSRKYIQTLNAIRGRANERVEAAVYNATKNVISSMNQDDIIASRGDKLTDMKGSLTEATRYMCRLLDIRGTVLPLTEEKVKLVGETHPGTEDYFGEVEVSKHIRNIVKLSYDHDIQISNEISEKIRSADLIIFSPGSLYTSILPHLIAPQVRKAINETSAPLMYVANLVTQPGETDEMSVSQHVEVLNRHLDQRKIDCVIANKGSIDQVTSERYKSLENKDLVLLDRDKLEAMGASAIVGDLIRVDGSGKIRHDELETAFLIFSYLMKYVD